MRAEVEDRLGRDKLQHPSVRTGTGSGPRQARLQLLIAKAKMERRAEEKLC